MKIRLLVITSILLISVPVFANDYTETDLFNLYKKAKRDDHISKYEFERIVQAARSPYAPTDSHAGSKFLEALSWYNDITLGNKDGQFSLLELETAFEEQLEKYLITLFREYSGSQRISAWKMLQKLEILKKIILMSGNSYYSYSTNKLSKISTNNDWNRKYTITSITDFNKRVVEGSWKKPVLVKFGLTYCVHCLLMEHLGSVPAVSRKYKDKMNVYKLWWNPNDSQNFYELNYIASQEGITSSPVFNLYIDGKLVKSEYAFPDEDGTGLEDYLEVFLTRP